MLNKPLLMVLYGSIFLLTTSCNQENKANTKTKSTMTTEAISKVNHYTERPYYTVQVNKGGSRFELLVNDLPAYSYMDEGGFSTLVPVNLNILKSGKQKLKLKVYPDKGKTKFDEGSYTNIEIRLYKDINDPTTEFTSLLKFSLPKEAIEKGLPYFEAEFPFEAVVPYNHSERLANAQEIKKDKDTQEKIIAAYTKARNLIEKLDAGGIDQLSAARNHIIMDVYYYTPEQIKDLAAATKANLEPEAKVKPIENYDIVYYAGGKVVSLQRKSDKGAILHSILNEGKEDEEVIDFEWLLYLPEGSNEFQVF